MDLYESGIRVLAVTGRNADEDMKTLSVALDIQKAIRSKTMEVKHFIISQKSM